jgi:hypothetical protein
MNAPAGLGSDGRMRADCEEPALCNKPRLAGKPAAAAAHFLRNGAGYVMDYHCLINFPARGRRDLSQSAVKKCGMPA